MEVTLTPRPCTVHQPDSPAQCRVGRVPSERARCCRSGVHRAPWGPRALPATGSEQTRWCVVSQTRSVGAPRVLEVREKQQGLDVELGPALLGPVPARSQPASTRPPPPWGRPSSACQPVSRREGPHPGPPPRPHLPQTRPTGRTHSLGLFTAEAPGVPLLFPDLLPRGGGVAFFWGTWVRATSEQDT